MRGTDWQANTLLFNNRGGLAGPNQPFKNFGGSIGGPVSIPKLYNGKNRTFFWIGAEGYRQISPLTKDLAGSPQRLRAHRQRLEEHKQAGRSIPLRSALDDCSRWSGDTDAVRRQYHFHPGALEPQRPRASQLLPAAKKGPRVIWAT